MISLLREIAVFDSTFLKIINIADVNIDSNFLSFVALLLNTNLDIRVAYYRI